MLKKNTWERLRMLTFWGFVEGGTRKRKGSLKNIDTTATMRPTIITTLSTEKFEPFTQGSMLHASERGTGR